MRKNEFSISESNQKNKSKNGVHFVVTYISSLDVIVRKNIFLPNMAQKMKELFR